MQSKLKSKTDRQNLKTRRLTEEEREERELRRTYLELSEVNALLEGAKYTGRNGVRNYALLLMMFRHGLRVSEAARLRWGAISFDAQTIFIARVKNSDSGVHPLQDDEVDALLQVKRLYPRSKYVFPNSRDPQNGKLATSGINKIMQQAAKSAGIEMLKIHPHTLRHSCGYFLCNDGYDTRLIQSWLGHRDIRNTVIYTKMNPARFNSIKWT